MAIYDVPIKVREVGNGVKTDFDFSFPVSSASEVKVGKILKSTEVMTDMVLGVDFTVTLNTATPGGTVSYTVAPTALQDSFVYREVEYTQTTDVPTNNVFRESSIEQMADKLEMQIQQLREIVARSVTLPITSATTGIEIPEPQAGLALVWDALGNLTNSDLRGEKGDKGDTGDAGANGADGANGIFSAIASQAEAEAGSENTKGMTALRTAQAIAALGYSGVASFVGRITRDMTANSGDVSYTGFGSQPKALIFLSGMTANGGSASMGFDNGTNCSRLSLWGPTPYYDIEDNTNTDSIFIYETSGGHSQSAKIKTLDADGLTLTWTKNGTPSAGTAEIIILALK